jgi:hypothetical protein
VASLRFLAERWDWSKHKVDGFMKLLKAEEMITTRTATGTAQTIITICKYDSYNFRKYTKRTVKGQHPDSTRTAPGQHPDKTNKENIVNNNTAASAFEVAFEAFLEMRRKIKKPATDYALTKLNNKLNRLSNGDTELKIKILDQSTLNCWQDVYELKTPYQALSNQLNQQQGPRPKTPYQIPM